jgi:hypothetical protein
MSLATRAQDRSREPCPRPGEAAMELLISRQNALILLFARIRGAM